MMHANAVADRLTASDTTTMPPRFGALRISASIVFPRWSRRRSLHHRNDAAAWRQSTLLNPDAPSEQCRIHETEDHRQLPGAEDQRQDDDLGGDDDIVR